MATLHPASLNDWAPVEISWICAWSASNLIGVRLRFTPAGNHPFLSLAPLAPSSSYLLRITSAT